MECVELIFVIEIAQKSKTMLTRAQCKKVKKDNAQRAWSVEDKSKMREGKGEKGKDRESGVNNGKSAD